MKKKVKKTMFLALFIFVFVACQRYGEGIIEGKWQICGSTWDGQEQELECGSENGEKIVFNANGIIKAKNSIYNNSAYRLEGDSILFVTMPRGEVPYRVEFFNNNKNMIIYNWSRSRTVTLIVCDICLKKIK